MRHNHFSMLPEKAFSPRAFGGMTLEGGRSGGGGGGIEEPPKPTRGTDPRPVSPYISAGGGFLGRAPLGTIGSSYSFPQSSFNADYYLRQNPDVARDPYYGSNPFHHYQDFGFAERRSPFQSFQYAPSQQKWVNEMYSGLEGGNLVNQAYQNIMGRTATPTEQSSMGKRMTQGLTGQGLVSAMTTAPEFQRQQEYNRAYTEAFRPGYQEFGPSGQYYQPIYQSSYLNYPSAARPYQPTYSTRMISPQTMNYGFGSFNPFSYAEGGDVAEDEGIAALRNA